MINPDYLIRLEEPSPVEAGGQTIAGVERVVGYGVEKIGDELVVYNDRQRCGAYHIKLRFVEEVINLDNSSSKKQAILTLGDDGLDLTLWHGDVTIDGTWLTWDELSAAEQQRTEQRFELEFDL